MNSIYADIVNLLTGGQPVALARIIRQSGSAPRSLGTACLILEDGTVKGTIGGGSLEYQVAEKAGQVLKTGESALIEFRLTGTDVAETQMLCGGLVDVYLEPLVPSDAPAIDFFRQVQALLETGRRGVLVTRIAAGSPADDPDARVLLRDDGPPVGSLPDAISIGAQMREELLACRQAALREMDESAGSGRLFVEPLEPESVLYLFGAGHVSTFVAPLAATAGFRVVVIDDRAEFANAQRFPQADAILVCPIAEAFEQIQLNPAAYVAIITRGHIHDHQVLKTALQGQPGYIGMIGSMRKRNLIYRDLIQAGVPPERLAQVHSPIGLDIGAETPQEIAVSIVAELIHVRALAPVPKEPFDVGQLR